MKNKLFLWIFSFLIIGFTIIGISEATLYGAGGICYNDGVPIDFSSLSWSQVQNYMSNNELVDAQNRVYVAMPTECAAGLKRELEWRGKNLSTLPIEWYYHSPTERLYTQITEYQIANYLWKLNDRKNMTIQDDNGNELFNVVSSTDIYQIGEITSTREWGYHNSGTEYVKTGFPATLKFDSYICIDKDNCLYYPSVYENISTTPGVTVWNKTRIITQYSDTLFKIDWVGSYDPYLTSDVTSYWGGVIPNKSTTNVFYDFEGDCNDESGNNYDCSLKTGASINNNMLLLNASVSSGARAEIFSQQFDINNDFSIIFDNVDYGNSGRLIYFSESDTMDVKFSGNNVQIVIKNTSGSYNTFTGSNSVNTAGGWSYFISYDDVNNRITTWYNGTVDINATHNGFLSDNTDQTLQIPRNGVAGTGHLDNFIMYNETLTKEDINSWLNLGGGGGDTTPPVISNVVNTTTNQSATITFTTDEAANASVNYGTTTSLGSLAINTTSTTSHTVYLKGLTNNTLYYYNITSCDSSGNCANSTQYSFTTNITVVSDTTSPVISNVVNTTTNQSATITWTTDEASNTTVYYGLTSGLGSISETDDSTTSHSRTLTGLINSTLYYYKVSSCDSSGNCANSTQYTFTTNDTLVPGANSTINFNAYEIVSNNSLSDVNFRLINRDYNLTNYDNFTYNDTDHAGYDDYDLATDNDNSTYAISDTISPTSSGGYDGFRVYGKYLGNQYVDTFYIDESVIVQTNTITGTGDVTINRGYQKPDGTNVTLDTDVINCGSATTCSGNNYNNNFTIGENVSFLWVEVLNNDKNFFRIRHFIYEFQAGTGPTSTGESVVDAGDYYVIAQKNGYYNVTESLTVDGISDDTLNIYGLYSTLLNISVIDEDTDSLTTEYVEITIKSNNYSYSTLVSGSTGSFNAPLIPGEYNFTIGGGSYAASTETYNISGTTDSINLTGFGFNQLYVTFRDSITESIISNVSIVFWSDLYSGSNFTSNGTVDLVLAEPGDYILQYNASGYDNNTYLYTMENDSFDSVTMYLNPSTQTVQITVEIVDEGLSPLENAEVKALKHFISTNTYNEVASGITNPSGETIMGLVTGSNYYKFVVNYGGETLKITNPFVITGTTIQIQVFTNQNVLDYRNSLGSIDTELLYNSLTNNFRFTFNDASNVVRQYCLYTYRSGVLEDLLINSTCTTGSSGTVLHKIANNSGLTYYSEAYTTISSVDTLVAKDSVSFGSVSFGSSGLLLQIVLTLLFSIAGFAAVELLFITAPLSIVIGGVLGLHSIGLAYTVPLLIVGIIIMFMLRRNA